MATILPAKCPDCGREPLIFHNVKKQVWCEDPLCHKKTKVTNSESAAVAEWNKMIQMEVLAGFDNLPTEYDYYKCLSAKDDAINWELERLMNGDQF